MAKGKQFETWCGKPYEMKKSKFSENKSIMHISDNMSGKMHDIPSVSTSCMCNPICKARMKNGNSICASCFAVATINHYKTLGVAMENNYELLNADVLPFEMLPNLKKTVEITRIESFGDVASETQAENYHRFITKNPHVMFAWWSKNMKIIEPIFNRLGKPSNVVMIESSPMVNVEIKPSSWIVDKVFTVFDDEYIKAHNVEINCGARDCNTCRRCYKKSTEKSVKERLK